MDNMGDIWPARSLFNDLEDRINHPRIPPSATCVKQFGSIGSMNAHILAK